MGTHIQPALKHIKKKNMNHGNANRRAEERTAGRTDGRMDERTDQRTKGRNDLRTYKAL